MSSVPSRPEPLDRLLAPYRLGDVALRNRVFVSAHTTNFGSSNLATETHVAYHRARAAGGVGLIITESLRVHPTSAGRDETLGLFDDSCIDPLARVSRAVHDEGGALFGQVMHIGRQADGGLARTAHWGASPVPWTIGAPVPHEMDRHEIALLVRAFGDGARRALAAEMDGLEVHLGHGHLLAQFLSPASNKRADRYGRDRQGRMRLAREALDAVFDVADGRPVGVRISAEEFLPEGLTSTGAGADDITEIVAEILDQLPLSFVNVSHSAYVGAWTLATQMADMTFPAAPFRELSRIVKDALPGVPVMAICRMDTLDRAADVLNAGDADMVGLTRAHIADPRLVVKALGADPDPVRHCIACNQGCIGRIEQNKPMSCVVNPEVGFEGIWDRWRATRAMPPVRRVAVVGAGPTGLSAAVAAARRGHAVTLLDRRPVAGGQITHMAARLAGRDRFQVMIDDLLAAVDHHGVTTHFGTEVDAETLGRLAPDAVVVATGSTPDTPHTGRDVWAAIEHPPEPGARVVVRDVDGTWAGAGLALHLATSGAEVWLVTPMPKLAWNVTLYSWFSLTRLLGEAGVRVRLLKEIAPAATTNGVADVVLTDVLNGEQEHLADIDDIIDVGPRRALHPLVESLESVDFDGDVVLAGDAYAPRTALEAVWEGHLAGVLAGGEKPPTLTEHGLPPYVIRQGALVAPEHG